MKIVWRVMCVPTRSWRPYEADWEERPRNRACARALVRKLRREFPRCEFWIERGTITWEKTR